jgi:hypothetical protein
MADKLFVITSSFAYGSEDSKKMKEGGLSYAVKSFPEINEFLEKGYSISEITPIISNNTNVATAQIIVKLKKI